MTLIHITMQFTLTRNPAPNFVIGSGLLLLQSWLPTSRRAGDCGRSTSQHLIFKNDRILVTYSKIWDLINVTYI